MCRFCRTFCLSLDKSESIIKTPLHVGMTLCASWASEGDPAVIQFYRAKISSFPPSG